VGDEVDQLAEILASALALLTLMGGQGQKPVDQVFMKVMVSALASIGLWLWKN
jgi:hypothetical protein